MIRAPVGSESPLAKVRCDVRMNWKRRSRRAHGEVVRSNESVELVAFTVTQQHLATKLVNKRVYLPKSFCATL